MEKNAELIIFSASEEFIGMLSWHKRLFYIFYEEMKLP